MDPETNTENASDAEPKTSVLMRKARAGSEVRQSQAMSLPKVLRITLAKVAESLLEMPMAVIGARSERREAEDLAELFSDDDLLIMFDGTMQQRAAVVFDPLFVGALIQQQTMGRVLPPFDGEPRKMTSTDAAICAPFVETLMKRAAPLLEDEQDREVLDGYTYGARVPETRLLLLALEEQRYEIVHLTVDIAGGVLQGKLMLCLPVLAKEEVQMRSLPEKPEPGSPVAILKPSLEKNVLGLNVDLHITLTSLNMPLSKVQGMAVGDIFDLGITAFDQAEVQTASGRKLSRGVLGQLNGTRALQVEHALAGQREPRRRVADRSTLALPKVTGDGTGTGADGRIPEGATLADWDADATADRRDGPFDLPGGNDLANMSDMPQMGDLGDLPDLTDLPDLGDLPDMSDLPGFEDEGELSLQLDVG